MKVAHRTRLEPEERRLQLLDVGLRVFARKGLRDTTLDEVAAEAGVTKPVVYHYFANKQAFFDAIAEREMTIVSGRILSGIDGPQAGYHFVEAAAQTFFEYLEERPDGFAALTGHAPINWYGDDRVSELRQQLYRRLSTFLIQDLRGHQCKLPDGLELHAHSIVGQFIFAGQFWLETRPAPAAIAARQLARVVWGGLRDLYASQR